MPQTGLPSAKWVQSKYRRWIVLDEPEIIAKVAVEYIAVVNAVSDKMIAKNVGVPGEDKVIASALEFLNIVDKVPAMLIPLIPGRMDGASVDVQAAKWGSILQAVWSFFLALRERGLGSAWTTVSTIREKEIARILGIPFEQYTQVGLFPIAYTRGIDFKKAWRKPRSRGFDL